MLFDINLEYKYSTIEKHMLNSEFLFTEHGPQLVGQNFLVLEDESDTVVSFMLSGTMGEEFIYKCIYLDQ